MTNDRSSWNDKALDAQFRHIEDVLDRIANALNAVDREREGWAQTLNRTEDRLNARLDERLTDLKEDVKQVGVQCRDIHSDFRETMRQLQEKDEQRATSRQTMSIGLISSALLAAGTILAAIITHGFK